MAECKVPGCSDLGVARLVLLGPDGQPTEPIPAQRELDPLCFAHTRDANTSLRPIYPDGSPCYRWEPSGG